MLCLDHIAVAAETLDAGQQWVENLLGVVTQPGGQHPRMGTQNRLLGLADNLYLEVIAIDPTLPAPDRARWFGLDSFQGPPRLVNWICRTTQLDQVLQQLPVGAGRAVSLSRGDLRWRMAIPVSGVLPYDQMFPAIMEWQDHNHPTDRLHNSGVELTTLTVFHPQADQLSKHLDPLLSDPRLHLAKGAPRLRAKLKTPTGVSVIL